MKLNGIAVFGYKQWCTEEEKQWKLLLISQMLAMAPFALNKGSPGVLEKQCNSVIYKIAQRSRQ